MEEEVNILSGHVFSFLHVFTFLVKSSPRYEGKVFHILRLKSRHELKLASALCLSSLAKREVRV